MRFVIFGAGAIGGVVGARLHQSGHDVVLIARGAHREAIAAAGLRLETPVEAVTLPIPVAGDPIEAAVGPGDIVLLCVKSQDTWPALLALREAAPGGVPVVCLQNGVENERVALRLFDEVLGCLVMCPTAHVEPGVVLAYGSRLTGELDVGRYPTGSDELCVRVSEAFAASQFDSRPRADIMRRKHAKLIANLGNAVQAVCGTESESGELLERVRSEGRAVLAAAGIPCDDDEVADARGRWERWGMAEIAGRPRGGGSTWQSVMRGTGRVESDYLNGEIVMRAREQGLAAPVNRLLADLAHETVRDHHQPGWLSPADVLARLDLR